jgi:hypothetical protein
VDVVCFSLSATRLPHYVAGVYSAMAVAGAVWCGPLVERLWKRGGGEFARTAGVVLLAAVGMVLATAKARSRLHAPVMADGSIAVDNREEAALLEDFFGKPDRSEPRVEPAVQGPLLMMREKRLSPINTAIFYSGRPVQRVVLGLVPQDGGGFDRYMYAPVPLGVAASGGARMLLVDRELVPAVEADWRFEPVAEGRSLVLGVVEGPR